MDSNELKPCPFCGGEAGIAMRTFYMEVNFSVCCDECGCSTPPYFMGEDDAIEAWNRRVGEQENDG